MLHIPYQSMEKFYILSATKQIVQKEIHKEESENESSNCN